MEITEKPLHELAAADYNPRIDLEQGDKEYENLKRSIETFGLVEPIVYNKRTERVVGGHQRLKVLQDLGYEEVEVSVVDISEEEEKTLNVALNRIEGDWDTEKLSSLLSELSEWDADLTLTGFDEAELDYYLSDLNIDDLFEESEATDDTDDAAEANNHNDKLDTAIELLTRAHDMLQETNDTYENDDLYHSIEYFLGGQGS